MYISSFAFHRAFLFFLTFVLAYFSVCHFFFRLLSLRFFFFFFDRAYDIDYFIVICSIKKKEKSKASIKPKKRRNSKRLYQEALKKINELININACTIIPINGNRVTYLFKNSVARQEKVNNNNNNRHYSQ